MNCAFGTIVGVLVGVAGRASGPTGTVLADMLTSSCDGIVIGPSTGIVEIGAGVATVAYGSIGRMSPDGPAANARGGGNAAVTALVLDAITFAGAVSLLRCGATSHRVAA
jgi:hypothetical protein